MPTACHTTVSFWSKSVLLYYIIFTMCTINARKISHFKLKADLNNLYNRLSVPSSQIPVKVLPKNLLKANSESYDLHSIGDPTVLQTNIATINLDQISVVFETPDAALYVNDGIVTKIVESHQIQTSSNLCSAALLSFECTWSLHNFL